MKLMDVNAIWFAMMKIDSEENGKTEFEKLIRNIDIKIFDILAFIAYIDDCDANTIIIKTKDKKLYKYRLAWKELTYEEIKNSVIDDIKELKYAYYNEKTLELKDVIQAKVWIEVYECGGDCVIYIDMNQFGNDDYLQTLRSELYKNIDKAINSLLEMKKDVNTFTNNDLFAFHIGNLSLEINEINYHADIVDMDTDMSKYY